MALLLMMGLCGPWVWGIHPLPRSMINLMYLKAYGQLEEEGLEILCGFESCKNSRTPSILDHRPAQTTRGIGPRCHLTAKTAQIDTKLFWVVKIGPQHAHNM